MWIFSQYGFFSVVREPASGLGSEASVARVQVRARHRAHLEGLRTAFPALLADAPIVGYDDPAHEAAYGHRDYEYRLFLTPAARGLGLRPGDRGGSQPGRGISSVRASLG